MWPGVCEQLDVDGADRHPVAAVVAHHVPGVEAGDPGDRHGLLAMGVDRDRHPTEQLGQALDPVAHHGPADVVGVVVGDEHAGDRHAIGGRDLEQVPDAVGRVHEQALMPLPIADQIGEVDHLGGDLV